MNISDIVELTIEKVVYQGKGLARYGKDKLSVFVDNVLPFETVKAKIVSINKNYATDKNWANSVYKYMQYLYGKV